MAVADVFVGVNDGKEFLIGTKANLLSRNALMLAAKDNVTGLITPQVFRDALQTAFLRPDHPRLEAISNAELTDGNCLVWSESTGKFVGSNFPDITSRIAVLEGKFSNLNPVTAAGGVTRSTTEPFITVPDRVGARFDSLTFTLKDRRVSASGGSSYPNRVAVYTIAANLFSTSTTSGNWIYEKRSNVDALKRSTTYPDTSVYTLWVKWRRNETSWEFWFEDYHSALTNTYGAVDTIIANYVIDSNAVDPGLAPLLRKVDAEDTYERIADATKSRVVTTSTNQALVDQPKPAAIKVIGFAQDPPASVPACPEVPFAAYRLQSSQVGSLTGVDFDFATVSGKQYTIRMAVWLDSPPSQIILRSDFGVTPVINFTFTGPNYTETYAGITAVVSGSWLILTQTITATSTSFVSRFSVSNCTVRGPMLVGDGTVQKLFIIPPGRPEIEVALPSQIPAKVDLTGYAKLTDIPAQQGGVDEITIDESPGGWAWQPTSTVPSDFSSRVLIGPEGTDSFSCQRYNAYAFFPIRFDTVQGRTYTVRFATSDHVDGQIQFLREDGTVAVTVTDGQALPNGVKAETVILQTVDGPETWKIMSWSFVATGSRYGYGVNMKGFGSCAALRARLETGYGLRAKGKDVYTETEVDSLIAAKFSDLRKSVNTIADLLLLVAEEYEIRYVVETGRQYMFLKSYFLKGNVPVLPGIQSALGLWVEQPVTVQPTSEAIQCSGTFGYERSYKGIVPTRFSLDFTDPDDQTIWTTLTVASVADFTFSGFYGVNGKFHTITARSGRSVTVFVGFSNGLIRINVLLVNRLGSVRNVRVNGMPVDYVNPMASILADIAALKAKAGI